MAEVHFVHRWQTIGNMIKWGRIKSHTPPITISKKLGVTIEEYNKIENDEIMPSDYQITTLAKILKLNKQKLGLLAGKVIQ